MKISEVKKMRWAGMIALSSLAFSGYSNEAVALTLTGGGPALTQSIDTTITITSFDGTKIAATLFTPNAPANTPVPLILHGNPWGGHRMTALHGTGITAPFLYTQSEEAVALAVENGYYAISFDERGWGDSGGTDEMMSAAYNGKDIEAVLNWADSHLGTQLARDASTGKMVVGTLGYSYGGSFQLLGASLDSRIQVMVPALTWHYLADSLGPGLPGLQPKTQWSQLLLVLGQVFGSQMNPTLVSFSKSVPKKGDEQDFTPLLDLAGPNGPNAYCGDTQFGPAPGQSLPAVPIFLVQGWKDSLFTANEGIQNAECLRAGGADVRLLVQQYGHQIPFSSPVPFKDGLIAVGMEQTPHCGNQSFDLTEAMFSFVDEVMFGPNHYAKHVDIPENCFTVDDNTGFTLNSIPASGQQYNVRIAQKVSGGGKNATFVPLYTATGNKAFAGIPHMTVNINSSDNPYAYFGIGVQRSGSRTVDLVDVQLYPIHGSGNFDADLVGVSVNLSKGDQIGIYAANEAPMFKYRTSESRQPPSFSFTGTFTLPPAMN
jgi:pimeloyl-ACP methyl ester carboxylesterase